MEIDDGRKREIETLLGRTMPASECGDVDDFLSFSQEDIREIMVIEKRSAFLVILYVVYRLRGEGRIGNAMSYYRSVVQEGVPVKDWYSSEFPSS